MIKSVIHKSNNNNIYLYDDQKRFSLLVHPDFEKACKRSKDSNPYYEAKYLYLKYNGFFAESRVVKFKTSIDETTIQESLVQTHQLLFEVTDFCNLRCRYCVKGDLYEGFREKESKNINTDSALKLLEYVFNIKNNCINKLHISFYGGEPLLNMNFIKNIVKVTNELNYEKKMKVVYGMTTNATLLHKYIDFLVKYDFELLISLDGNERNNSYRVFGKNGKNSFFTVIDNIDMVRRKYPKYFNDNVMFNAVLHNRNSVKDIYSFIYNRYNKIPRISELLQVNAKCNKKNTICGMFNSRKKSENEYYTNEKELSRITHHESVLFTELMRFVHFFSVNYYLSHLNALLIEDDKKYLPTNTCLPFSKKMYLTNHSIILPCEKLHHKYEMGKVDENIVINISEIAQKMSRYYEEFEKKCQYCYVYRFCGTCMFRLKSMDYLGTEKFVCDNFHDQKSFEIKLSRIFSFMEKYPHDFVDVIENMIIES